MIDVEMYIAQQFYSPEAAAQARRDIKWAIDQMQKELDRAKNASAIHEANVMHYSAEVAELTAKLRRAK